MANGGLYAGWMYMLGDCKPLLFCPVGRAGLGCDFVSASSFIEIAGADESVRLANHNRQQLEGQLSTTTGPLLSAVKFKGG